MNYEQVFQLAEPYLKKNDFGMPHTRRVFEIAKKNFEIPKNIEELVFCSIIMHDIGGSTIEKQYKNGPEIATTILKNLGCPEAFVKQVCEFVRTHHDHPDSPSLAFKILYDSDKLVMFSPEEYPYYTSNPKFDWNQIIALIYHDHAKELAKQLLQKRRNK
ncbi:MAG: HD domain-containing protein [Candidatus Bathyarchaeota archaeon]|nr:MAG: HD domain-containing protein [Candidatus Bathyarchaeota archaeon]